MVDLAASVENALRNLLRDAHLAQIAHHTWMDEVLLRRGRIGIRRGGLCRGGKPLGDRGDEKHLPDRSYHRPVSGKQQP